MSLTILSQLFAVLAQTLSIYSLVLLVRVLLSWFPNLDWSNPVLSTVSSITDPYLNAFRGLIPPIGGLDLSALIAFLALSLGQSLLGAASGSLMGAGSGFGY
ncbi:MAG: YggT family protein [Cyanobium sp.]|jgi:YggT family protein|uniref:YggT family protein n=1 Tax=unclassified Synechococcus TaxID=2626047 RepID=UPI000DBC27DC|nr:MULTISPECIES: YggT family protein [unclassified Synechococcus]MCP9828946.1 YggT family protein [Synechococcus sp. L2F]MCP9845301.1 YggT family protein [Synechococcus sp. Lug-A]PZV24914.1 MAG: YggT family protein [Cyanobium sp.]